MDVPSFVRRLRVARAAAFLTQSDVANYLGINSSTVSNWECGKCSPGVENLAELATLYQVTSDWLLKGSPPLPDLAGPLLRCQHGIPMRDRCRRCERGA